MNWFCPILFVIYLQIHPWWRLILVPIWTLPPFRRLNCRLLHEYFQRVEWRRKWNGWLSSKGAWFCIFTKDLFYRQNNNSIKKPEGKEVKILCSCKNGIQRKRRTTLENSLFFLKNRHYLWLILLCLLKISLLIHQFQSSLM